MEFVTTVGGQSYFQYAWTEISGIRGLFSVCAYTITVPDPNFFPDPYTNSTIFQTLTLIYMVSYLDFLFPSTSFPRATSPQRELSLPWNFQSVELSSWGGIPRSFTQSNFRTHRTFAVPPQKQCKQCNQDKQWALAVSHGRIAVYYRYAATCRDGVHDHHN